jgi:hypothetical protein
MGPAQREAVWRALNDDAEKLLAESAGSPDRDSRKLKEELAECQKIFNRLNAEASARGTERERKGGRERERERVSVCVDAVS